MCECVCMFVNVCESLCVCVSEWICMLWGGGVYVCVCVCRCLYMF